ncbi:MAG: hypothetical protein ACKOPQ_05890, partial [Novosphingobium sp.]
MIGEADVHRVGIRRRVYRDRLDPHFVRCAVNAQRDLAAVGDQDAGYRHRALADHDQRLVELHRLRVFDQDLLD